MPTTGARVTASTTHTVVERIKRLTAGGCTVLLVSHSMLQVDQFCGRSLWLEKGRVVMDDSTAKTIAAYETFMASVGTAS